MELFFQFWVRFSWTEPNPHLNHLVHPNHFKPVHADGPGKGMLEEVVDTHDGCGWWNRGGSKGQESLWERGRRLEGIGEICEEKWQSSVCSPSRTVLSKPTRMWPPLFSILPHPQSGPQQLHPSPFPQAAHFQCPDIRGKWKHWADFATRKILALPHL